MSNRKWTPEQKAKFKETLRVKREARLQENFPPRAMSLSEQIRERLNGIERELARLTQEKDGIVNELRQVLQSIERPALVPEYITKE